MIRMYRVTVHRKGTPVEPGLLYVSARNKREAIALAHKEADRKLWFDRWAIYPHDLVRIDPTTKNEVER